MIFVDIHWSLVDGYIYWRSMRFLCGCMVEQVAMYMWPHGELTKGRDAIMLLDSCVSSCLYSYGLTLLNSYTAQMVGYYIYGRSLMWEGKRIVYVPRIDVWDPGWFDE